MLLLFDGLLTVQPVEMAVLVPNVSGPKTGTCPFVLVKNITNKVMDNRLGMKDRVIFLIQYAFCGLGA